MTQNDGVSSTRLYEVVMPDLQGAEEIVIGAWTKKSGDHVDEGETLVEARTDKVNAEIPSPVAGTVEELLLLDVFAGTAFSVGATVTPE